jgi:hypothetical protein
MHVCLFLELHCLCVFLLFGIASILFSCTKQHTKQHASCDMLELAQNILKKVISTCAFELYSADYVVCLIAIYLYF